MNYVQRRQLKNQQDREAEHSLIRLRQGSVGSMSHNEATVRAMIENARSSSWKENLNNAMDAHDRFMLGSQNKNEPEFVEWIRKRSEEIVKDSDQGGGNR
eukprot:CAMPEP_0202448370 /NCGR_PEP_ID=MMETSP1360-20130828/7178_1 /ASSEMBLY_ACC=CAM_ASM_000848 /TAXON_ID=515479 /ORGANISM="Licmophora paradoxa, Strain CCMP2313" /LENGTH=99 /DNA_ID=CAMNT_0049065901 /DNA_START=167 /DNA_END=466 /DNA_ORIENTATION=-